MDIEDNGIRQILPRHLQPDIPLDGNQSFITVAPGHIEQNLGELNIVFDDEHDFVAAGEQFTVVLDRFRRGRRLLNRTDVRALAVVRGDDGIRNGRFLLGHKQPVRRFLRQIQCKGASFALYGPHRDQAAQQFRQPLADR
ncbi:hypothetical protein D1872_251940 [compost metagenome]